MQWSFFCLYECKYMQFINQDFVVWCLLCTMMYNPICSPGISGAGSDGVSVSVMEGDSVYAGDCQNRKYNGVTLNTFRTATTLITTL